MPADSLRFRWIKAVTGSHLDGHCKSILIVGLSMHMTADGEHCHVGVDRIARETGWSRRTVQQRLRALDELFVLIDPGGGRWFKGKGRTNEYFPLIPKDIPAAVRQVKTRLRGDESNSARGARLRSIG